MNLKIRITKLFPKWKFEVIFLPFLSHFLSTSPWRSADLLKSVRTKAIQTIGKNGVLILDESSIKKSGNSSVGVSHQYCGNLGKKDNCQVGVFLAYFKKKRRRLIDERLYIPQNGLTTESVA